jgi:hypothetical protein
MKTRAGMAGSRTTRRPVSARISGLGLGLACLASGCASLVANDPLLGGYYDECIKREKALWPKHLRDDDRIDESCRAEARQKGAPEKQAARREVTKDVFVALAAGLSAASCSASEGAERIACEEEQSREQRQRQHAEAQELLRDEGEKNRSLVAEMHEKDLAAKAAENDVRAPRDGQVGDDQVQSMFPEGVEKREAWSCWYGVADQRPVSLCFQQPSACARSFVDASAKGVAMHGTTCLAQDVAVCFDAADGRSAITLCAAGAEHCDAARTELAGKGWSVGKCVDT